MSGQEWTDDEVVLLRELIGKGYTASQIGIQLGRVRNAIIGKWHRLGIQRPNRSYTNLSAIRKLWIGGHTMSEIAEKVGTSVGTVQGRIARLQKQNKAPRRRRSSLLPNLPSEPLPLPNLPSEPLPEKKVDLVPKVGFRDLRLGQHCLWIPGNPDGLKTMYCGSVPVDGSSYCAYHCHMSYRTRTKPAHPTAWLHLVDARRAKKAKLIQQQIKSSAALSPDGAA